MDLIQLQIRKAFYDLDKSKKALAFADSHYNFLQLLQYLNNSKILVGTKTNQVPYEIWSILSRKNSPTSELINLKIDFDQKLINSFIASSQK